MVQQGWAKVGICDPHHTSDQKLLDFDDACILFLFVRCAQGCGQNDLQVESEDLSHGLHLLVQHVSESIHFDPIPHAGRDVLEGLQETLGRLDLLQMQLQTAGLLSDGCSHAV